MAKSLTTRHCRMRSLGSSTRSSSGNWNLTGSRGSKSPWSRNRTPQRSTNSYTAQSVALGLPPPITSAGLPLSLPRFSTIPWSLNLGQPDGPRASVTAGLLAGEPTRRPISAASGDAAVGEDLTP